jgi:hypothetical protein
LTVEEIGIKQQFLIILLNQQDFTFFKIDFEARHTFKGIQEEFQISSTFNIILDEQIVSSAYCKIEHPPSITWSAKPEARNQTILLSNMNHFGQTIYSNIEESWCKRIRLSDSFYNWQSKDQHNH